jgi:hypothetical protein
MTDKQPDYLSYLLRLWRAKEKGRWRASVERAGTHERRSFASLEALFDFLREQTGPPLEGDKGDQHQTNLH